MIFGDRGAGFGRVSAENRVTSCYLQILVDEAAEPVSSVRRWVFEVLEVCTQHDVEVAWSSDQEVIEDFAQGLDPSRSSYMLHDRSATPANSSWYSSCWTTVR